MKPSFALLFACGVVSAMAASGLAPGCAATGGAAFGDGANGQGDSGTGAQGGVILEGGTGGTGGSVINPCGSKCGPEELCDAAHAGLDDNCNGSVDEGCPCSMGMVQSCFKGDPSYRNMPGCFPGSQHCSEFGSWDDCVGGVHATDHCYDAPTTGCHPIQSPPFVTVNLKTGTGSFSGDATSESWTVDCPAGVSPCPGVSGSSFQPLQSGEYTVHYTKQSANGPGQCDYPLLVGAPGLRVELEWEHNLGGEGVDLDLHMHKPQDTGGWGAYEGNGVDCGYDNCTVTSFGLGSDPLPWFSGATPPDPVAWFLDPVPEGNTCYYAPRGRGDEWKALGKGCHNPRLDLDNIQCDPGVSDVDDSSFCAPENINIDFPPTGQWIRIGVDYYNNHFQSYSVHPRVRIFCNAALAAELGPAGFNAPITFAPGDGQGAASGNNKFWMVADVRFAENDPCLAQSCEVQTIYADANAQTPLIVLESSARQSFGPAYPP
jgi:hypothetical protein